jgi:hypothetical protein
MPDVSDLYDHLSAHGFTDVLDADLNFILNGVVLDVNRELPFYLDATNDVGWDEGSDTPRTTGDDSWPQNVSAIKKLINPTTGTIILPEEHEYLMMRYANTLTQLGEPFFYYFIGEELHVFPIPDADLTLNMSYVQFQIELDQDSDEDDIILPARYHFTILKAGMLKGLYAMEDDYNAAGYWSNQFDASMLQALMEINMKQLDRPARIYTDDAQDYAEIWY